MNITLIGMPGAGKSYMGKILAEKLGYGFVDTDKLLEKKFKKDLQSVVNSLGDKDFLKEEVTAITELKNLKRTIISPGGSVIYSPEAMAHVKKISKVVFLNVPLQMIKERILEGSRGIIGIKDKTLDTLYEERVPLYYKYADLVVNDTEEKTADDIVSEIASGLEI